MIRILQTHKLEVLVLQRLSSKVGNNLAGPQELSSKAGRAPGVLAHKDQQFSLVRDLLKAMPLRSKVLRPEAISMDKDLHQETKEIDPTMVDLIVGEVAEFQTQGIRAKEDPARAKL